MASKTPGGIPMKDWRLAQRIARKHRVDPLVLVAIGKIETDWGRLGDGRKGNILGVGSFDSGSSYKWAGVRNQLKKGAELLQSWGVRGIHDIKAGKAASWATDPNWENAVSSMYSQLAGGHYSTVSGRPSRRGPSRLVATTTKTPGVDMSGQRQALRMDTLTTALSQHRMPSQTELLALGTSLRDLQDVPGETNVELKVKPGKRMRGGRGGGRGVHKGMPREAGGHYGEIFEAFFDPAGQYYDEGSFAKGAIGGHSDHVHVSASPKYVVWLGRKAQKMGLRVSENPAFDQVDPVHTQGSYHYSKRAIDVSGDAQTMAKFYGKVMKRARAQHYRPHNH